MRLKEYKARRVCPRVIWKLKFGSNSKIEIYQNWWNIFIQIL